MNIFKSLLLERHLTYFQSALWATFAFLMFSISDSFAKWLVSEGYDKSLVLVTTSVPSAIALSLLMVHRHGLKRAYHTKYKKLHLARCVAMIGVTFAMFEALKFLPLADYYGIVFSSPFFVTLGALILFKERIDLKEWLTIIIGFIGVVIVINPDYSNFNIGYIFALAAAMCGSTAALIVRKIGREEDPYLFVIFANIAIIIANIVPSITHTLPETITMQHIIVFAIYCITIPLAILVISAVYSRAPSVSAVAPYQYSQMIWGGLIGYLVFSDVPTLNLVIGGSIVILCGLYTLQHHAQKRRCEAKPT